MSSRALLLLTLLVAASTLLSPFQRDLFVGDETKYGQIIREMRQTGSLVVPQLEGRPYTHKPPLHFWMIWLLTFVFGVNSLWPFVIPSLLAYGGLVLLAGLLAREILGRGEAVAMFAVSSFLLVWGLAQTARMDPTYVLLLSAAVLLFWRWLGDERPGRMALAGALIGVAILVKGPMAAVMFLYLAVAQAIRHRKGWRKDYLYALLPAAVIPLLWVVPAAILGGEQYSREMLVEQNVGRAVSAWTHAEPPWFYLAHYPATFLPWSLAGIPALAAIWTRHDDLPKASKFCLDWVLAVVIPFSLLSSKLDVYMLPAMVPLALLLARSLSLPREDGVDRWGVVLSRLLVIVLGVVFALAGTVAARWIEKPNDRALAELPAVKGLMLAAAGAALIGLGLQLAWGRRSALRNAVVAALVTLVPFVGLSAALMPVANGEVSSAPLVAAVQKQGVAGTDVGLYGTPHLSSRTLPPSLETVRYLGAGALAPESAIRPLVVAVREDREEELGAALRTDYVRVDEVTLKGKDVHVYRRR